MGKEVRQVIRLSAGKGFVRAIGRNLDEAVSAQVAALQIKNGISDVDIPISMFEVEAYGRRLENTGAYLVQWRTGFSYKTARFGSKEEAEKFAATKQGPSVHAERRFGEYNSYKIRAINPTNGEYVDVDFGIKFESKAEAKTYIEEHLGELSAKVVDEIFTEEKIERKVGRYFDVIKDYRSGDYMVVYNGTNWIHSTHKSIDEARAEAERKSEEYAKLEESQRKIVHFSTEERPRVGKDYRGGKDAAPEMFTDAFGFRGVQFGNWTNAKDRQEALNQAYDAFMDLAELLGKSPRAMSLNGELGLAFGARGSGKALAHYETDEVVINLTKTKGAGSLAHEWWHALDNYFARRGGVTYGFACEMPSVLRDELRDDMARLMKAVNQSNYGVRCAGMSSYWRSSREVTARLFAEYVSSKLDESGSSNSFLSRGASDSGRQKFMEGNWRKYQMCVSTTLARYGTKKDFKPMTYDEFMASPMALEGYAYPTPKEIAELKPHIDKFINDIREDEGGAMFHKVENTEEVGAILPAEEVLVDGLVGVLRDAGIEAIADVEIGQHVIDDENRNGITLGLRLAIEDKENGINAVPTAISRNTDPSILSSTNSDTKIDNRIEVADDSNVKLNELASKIESNGKL
ncbi:MAG: LPD5 domain-containing protein, partial [Muribaculaceae bacterium]